jgi:Uma2 family endonuclease
MSNQLQDDDYQIVPLTEEQRQWNDRGSQMGEAEKRSYTYKDYLEFPDVPRVEILYGDVYQMSAPTYGHQAILVEMTRQFSNFLFEKPCKVVAAPFDVRLFADPATDEAHDKKDDTMVVQPDISIICDAKKIHRRGCYGAPNLVVEILSPSNSKTDVFIKLNAYRQAGVEEYWIVDPETKTILCYILKDGSYAATFYGQTDKVPVGLFPGFYIDMAAAFAQDIAVED